MFLLDTNVISTLRRPDKAPPNVRAWAERSPSHQHMLSVATVLELEQGVLLMERRDPIQGAILRRWLEWEVIDRFADRILGIDTAVARRCVRLHVPDPRPERDALNAATALVHGLTVVTRNVADFEGLGVPLLNPWEASA